MDTGAGHPSTPVPGRKRAPGERRFGHVATFFKGPRQKNFAG
jgi:hypothetical protein